MSLIPMFSGNMSGAIEFVGVAEADTAGENAGSLTIDKPAGVVEGDIMVAFLGQDDEETWTGDTGWTEVIDAVNRGDVRIAYKVAGPSEGSSYTFTINSSTRELSGCIVAYRNAAYDTVGSHGSVSGGTTITAPGVTAASDGSVLLAFFNSNNAATYSSPSSGLTEVASDQDGNVPNVILYSEENISAGATGDKTVTISASEQHDGVLLVLGPA